MLVTSTSCDLGGQLSLRGDAVATGVLVCVSYRRQWVVSPRHVFLLEQLAFSKKY